MADVLVPVALFAAIVVWAWLDQRGRVRRRELEHAERLRALELGRPLEDAETARAEALGAIGVAVGVSSFAAAALATCFILYLELELRFLILLIVWPVCALAGAGTAILCVHALGPAKFAPSADGGAPAGATGSEQVTRAPREFGP
jgi:hypothetical protein